MDPLHAAVVAEAAARAIKNYEDSDGVWPENPGAQGRHNGVGSAHSTKDESQEKFVLDPALQLELEKYGKQESHDTHELEHKKQDGQLFATSVCTRCKKEFTQMLGKHYRLCSHCRELQRQRSRRWQMRTKEKQGVCRRCGVEIPPEHAQFVLCENCRMSLRSRKASRAALGKCVHCSGPNDSIDAKFKVCSRCRQNDKIRRSNLEKIGACNRCAKRLKESDRDHKVCEKCRTKKKRGLSAPSTPNKRVALATEHHNGSKHSVQQASAEAVAAAVLNGQQSGHDQDIMLPDNFHNLPQIHHSQLNQQLNQQLHQQLSQLGQDHSSSNTDEDEGGNSSNGEDVGGSLTIPNPDRICLKCGNHIHIDDLSFNPAANICSKCLENDDDPETTANLFMNPEGDVIGKNA
ncbi:hypothetical protein KL925_000348 [Ogataea polymorpha]|uniref:Uncharacterized protein n=1 Tax=Ogataea polymorpha TaxID=460523 RepID=A0A1B7SEX3_9ASCO|nr:uncharacterized protein OGAPODRAFT_94856 [Ogataea polymorpha]KAG7882953.1 hypothetical protein KL937_000126 [Ogataea polymorpha]KAG7889612.1 hypothetical protein KL908_004725 [Ogataea polymorpha]KAG7895640.1 hypothetical protein KL936_000348 [Ogataea polymorpha]KAG7904285.1 hypothetical protein KL935_000424 [Ogataea polymorpha]KAG7908214.1 hypothetical protein KL907_001704 [Ogataea polymorpha]